VPDSTRRVARGVDTNVIGAEGTTDLRSFGFRQGTGTLADGDAGSQTSQRDGVIGDELRGDRCFDGDSRDGMQRIVTLGHRESEHVSLLESHDIVRVVGICTNGKRARRKVCRRALNPRHVPIYRDRANRAMTANRVDTFGATDIAGSASINLDPKPDSASANTARWGRAQWERRIVAVTRKLQLRERLIGFAVGECLGGRESEKSDQREEDGKTST